MLIEPLLVAVCNRHLYANDDPTLILKRTDLIGIQGGIKLETYVTKTFHEGNSPYEIVTNISGVESINYRTPTGIVSHGLNGSLTYGNSILSIGLDQYGNLLIDIAVPIGKSSTVGTTLYLSKQPFVKLEKAFNNSFNNLNKKSLFHRSCLILIMCFFIN